MSFDTRFDYLVSLIPWDREGASPTLENTLDIPLAIVVIARYTSLLHSIAGTVREVHQKQVDVQNHMDAHCPGSYFRVPLDAVSDIGRYSHALSIDQIHRLSIFPLL